MRYVIENDGLDFVLYSINATNFGGDAKNFVCRGTKEYCERIQQMLEKARK